MPSFKFTGLSPFDYYSMQIGNGSTALEARGYQGIVPGSGAITISVRRGTLQVAPEGVGFTATIDGEKGGPGPADVDFGDGNVYDPRFHELIYRWDFGDTPRRFTHVENLPAAWNDTSIAYGPVVQHTYRTPGTYTVTLSVFNPRTGDTHTQTTGVSVGDPETVFAGSNTLFVDPAGVHANAPADAALYTDFDTAFAAAATGGNRRVMLEDGAAATCTSHYVGGAYGSVHLCAVPGAVTRPVISWVPGGTRAEMFRVRDGGAGRDLSVSGLRFQGPYDSTTETGPVDVDCFQIEANPHRYLHLHDCIFDGFQDACISTSTESNGQTRMINDCLVTNWRNFAIGCFSKSNDRTDTSKFLAIVGCNLAQHVDALAGNGDKANNNTHGPVRIGDGDTCAILQNDMFSRCGWSAGESGFIAIQPCLRLNSRGKPGQRSNVSMNTMEGGDSVLTASVATNGDDAGDAGNILIDMNLLIGDHMTQRFVDFSAGSATVRNCIGINPDTATLGDGSFGDPVAFVAGYKISATTDAGRASPVFIYNNTFVNLMTDAATNDDADMLIKSPVTLTMIEDNNVLHQPNLGQPETQDAPFTVAEIPAADGTTPVMPRSKGFTDHNNPTVVPGTGSPADTVRTYIPATGSGALAAATGPRRAPRDFFTASRAATPSRGAVEGA